VGRNITIKLDEALLRDARVLAARQGKSVSALIAELLEARVRDEASYERARKRALNRLHKGYRFQWSRPRSRDELHER
jgi:hypothetical protein